jgi:acyl carrier protein
MTDVNFQAVQMTLGLHLRVDPGTIELEQDLELDLGLDPLDLVLVVLRLEELECAEFPIADLETVVTVGDLVALVRSWSSLGRSASLPPPPQSTKHHRPRWEDGGAWPRL